MHGGLQVFKQDVFLFHLIYLLTTTFLCYPNEWICVRTTRPYRLHALTFQVSFATVPALGCRASVSHLASIMSPPHTYTLHIFLQQTSIQDQVSEDTNVDFKLFSF